METAREPAPKAVAEPVARHGGDAQGWRTSDGGCSCLNALYWPPARALSHQPERRRFRGPESLLRAYRQSWPTTRLAVGAGLPQGAAGWHPVRAFGDTPRISLEEAASRMIAAFNGPPAGDHNVRPHRFENFRHLGREPTQAPKGRGRRRHLFHGYRPPFPFRSEHKNHLVERPLSVVDRAQWPCEFKLPDSPLRRGRWFILSIALRRAGDPDDSRSAAIRRHDVQVTLQDVSLEGEVCDDSELESVRLNPSQQGKAVVCRRALGWTHEGG